MHARVGMAELTYVLRAQRLLKTSFTQQEPDLTQQPRGPSTPACNDAHGLHTSASQAAGHLLFTNESNNRTQLC